MKTLGAELATPVAVELKSSLVKQTQALAIPMVTDVVGGIVGWVLGRVTGKGSLYAGLAVYALGKYHTLHENISVQMQRDGYDVTKEGEPFLSGWSPYHQNTQRVYYGESPLVMVGMGMILGGATAAFAGKKTKDEGFGQKAKTAFSEIWTDLKNRSYFVKEQQEQVTEEVQAEEVETLSGKYHFSDLLFGDTSGESTQFEALDKIESDLQKMAVDFNQNSHNPVLEQKPQSVNSVDGLGELELMPTAFNW
jgi:hypothetical protein